MKVANATKETSGLQARGAQLPSATACSTCGRPFKNSQRSGTCSGCRVRATRQRRKLAEREDPELSRPAYLSDELRLSEAGKAGAELLARTPIKDPETGERIGTLGVLSMDELLGCIERNGRADGIIESAWALPLWQFRQVQEDLVGRARFW